MFDNSSDYQEDIDALREFDPDNFELPEAILVGEDEQLTATEFEEGKFSFSTYSTAEDAELALEIARSYEFLDATTRVRRVQPREWLEFVRTIGPCLVEILLIYRVTKNGQSFWRVPILDFLRKVNTHLLQRGIDDSRDPF